MKIVRVLVLIFISLLSLSMLWMMNTPESGAAVYSEYQPAALRVTQTLPPRCDFSPGPGDIAGLINAIYQANLDPALTIICLGSGYYEPVGTPFEIDGSNMLPDITSQVWIHGGGARIQRPQGTPRLERFFHVAASGTLRLDMMSIVNGSEAKGGAIYNEGNLTLYDVYLGANNAFESGGAIYNEGSSVYIDTCDFEGNWTQGVPGTYGGAIYSTAGALTISYSGISGGIGNAAYYGGGIAVVGQNGPATLRLQNYSVIASNAAEFGGGIYLGPNTTTLITGQSKIEVNSAQGGGGGIAVVGDSGTSGSAQVTIQNGVVIGSNTSTQGGGMQISGSGAVVTVRDSQIIHNRASMGEGGGFWLRDGAAVNVTNSVISRNQGGVTGGLYAQHDSSVTVHESCIVGNIDYGIYVDSPGTPGNATNNWWGAADGPGGMGTGAGDKVAFAYYDPYLTVAPSICADGIPPTLTATAELPPTLVLITFTPSITVTMTPWKTATPTPIIPPAGCRASEINPGEIICTSD
ncbi:MAG TPA: right-handed parallel beta-helix repeat-containing protein [Aggregatilineaceae bacterium]|nr:right-handed parallel beta-helix repeat-containing protein [Aggregatilineaceae bacterium]